MFDLSVQHGSCDRKTSRSVARCVNGICAISHAMITLTARELCFTQREKYRLVRCHPLRFALLTRDSKYGYRFTSCHERCIQFQYTPSSRTPCTIASTYSFLGFWIYSIGMCTCCSSGVFERGEVESSRLKHYVQVGTSTRTISLLSTYAPIESIARLLSF